MVAAIAVPAFAAEPPQWSEGDTTVIDLTYEAVSYTHLDVYKRQEITLAIRTSSNRRIRLCWCWISA